MKFRLLTPNAVAAIHDAIQNPGELPRRPASTTAWPVA